MALTSDYSVSPEALLAQSPILETELASEHHVVQNPVPQSAKALSPYCLAPQDPSRHRHKPRLNLQRAEIMDEQDGLFRYRPPKRHDITLFGMAILDKPHGPMERFVKQQTHIGHPPLSPETPLHLGIEIAPLWEATECHLNEQGLLPPFWAFAWAGGQGLARFCLDHPSLFYGKRIVDFASGSGLCAIAAKLAGADTVLASDIDSFAVTAIGLNATLSDVNLDICLENIIGQTTNLPEILLAGDIFYDEGLARQTLPWFQTLHQAGVTIYVGDPGRPFFPKQFFREVARYSVPGPEGAEDRQDRRTMVYEFHPG